jgi:hypothetical protein
VEIIFATIRFCNSPFEHVIDGIQAFTTRVLPARDHPRRRPPGQADHGAAM